MEYSTKMILCMEFLDSMEYSTYNVSMYGLSCNAVELKNMEFHGNILFHSRGSRKEFGGISIPLRSRKLNGKDL